MKQFYFLILLLSTNLYSQTPTVGLIYNDANAYDGYTLFAGEYYNKIHLINNCGQVINEWTSSNSTSISYLLENGDLLKAGNGIVERFDWDGNLQWSYDFNSNGFFQHHDIEPLPNGNFLIIDRDYVSDTNAILAGRDPGLLSSSEIDLVKILEIQPVGFTDINIVWEWNLFDHLIQDFDASKSNFGVVTNYPELMDFNFDTGDSYDWIHPNGIDYNEDLDQIIFSSRNTNEVYIIDHSTTTLEAASHSGGNSGKGGDFLWRWGNPIVYKQGNSSDQILFQHHDPNWIPNGYPNAGMISIFNNNSGESSAFSAIELVNPSIDINGDYELSSNKYLPANSYWSWNGNILGEKMYSSKKGGSTMVPNGNFLIAESDKGRLSEVTDTGFIVWVYEIPLYTSILNQYSSPTNNTIFKSYKYANDYAGFSGRDMTPSSIIESVNTVSDTCISALSTNDYTQDELLTLYPNPVKNQLNLSKKLYFNIQVIDLTGKIILTEKNLNTNQIMLPNSMMTGVYYVKIEDLNTNYIYKSRIIKE